jgi:hypothetical protein
MVQLAAPDLRSFAQYHLPERLVFVVAHPVVVLVIVTLVLVLVLKGSMEEVTSSRYPCYRSPPTKRKCKRKRDTRAKRTRKGGSIQPSSAILDSAQRSDHSAKNTA